MEKHVLSSISNEITIKRRTECRICLNNALCLPIFGKRPQQDFSNDIRTFGAVDISKDDEFSKYICADCLKLLDAAVLFREQARRSSRRLKQRKNGNRVDAGMFESKAEGTPVKIEKSESESHLNDIPSSSEDSAENYDLGDENSLNDGENEDTDDENETYMIIVGDNTENEVEGDDEKPKFDKISIKNEEETGIQPQSSKTNCGRVKSKKYCNLCKIIIPVNVVKHFETVHSKAKFSESHIREYCEICKQLFTKTMYALHVRLVHNGQSEQRQCEFCKKMYNYDYLRRHIRRTHPYEKRKTTMPRIITVYNKE